MKDALQEYQDALSELYNAVNKLNDGFIKVLGEMQKQLTDLKEIIK